MFLNIFRPCAYTIEWSEIWGIIGVITLKDEVPIEKLLDNWSFQNTKLMTDSYYCVNSLQNISENKKESEIRPAKPQNFY